MVVRSSEDLISSCFFLMSFHSENKRLAKNTLVLYARMLLTMLVGLYTSRVILQVLGISDYGIFHVVGGMVYMFSFVNTALTGGTQRFITYTMGKNNLSETENVFRVAFTLHVILAIVFLIIMEIGGIFFFKTILNIPEERENAALWVFHICTIVLCIELIRLLLEADIISNEKMDFYAYVSVAEVVLKLCIVYVLFLFPDLDKLKLYSVLYLLSTLVILIISSVYCKRNFKECVFKLKYDRKIFREIGSYTGWNLITHISYMISMQGVNVALNVFLGPIVNAARGVSVQVNAAVSRFTSNYLTATVPQIIKLYAVGKVDEMFILVKNVSKFSVFLYMLIGIPLFLEMETILDFWLEEVPKHTVVFTRILLIESLVVALSNSLSRIITATGRIKRSNICDLSFQLTTFLIILYLLYRDCDVDIVMCLVILPRVLSFINQLYIVKIYTGARVQDYFTEIIPKVILVFICSIIPPLIPSLLMSPGFTRILVVLLMNTTFCLFFIYFLGIDSVTRHLLVNKIVCKLKK